MFCQSSKMQLQFYKRKFIRKYPSKLLADEQSSKNTSARFLNNFIDLHKQDLTSLLEYNLKRILNYQ